MNSSQMEITKPKICVTDIYRNSSQELIEIILDLQMYSIYVKMHFGLDSNPACKYVFFTICSCN